MNSFRRLIVLVALVVAVLVPTGSASADAGFEGRVLELVNQERTSRGLPALTVAGELRGSARGYAAAMASGGFFTHNAPDGSTPTSRIEAAGYRDWSFVGENLAGGQTSPEAVVTSWMNSPGHRKNVLSPDAREIGIGHLFQPGTKYGHYWVQHFGARASAPLASRALPAPQSGCAFTLGFKALRDQIPGIVGACLEDVHHNPANGDGLQRAAGGLLVWRKADNFTAFTDGHRSWVNGPHGVQVRLNSERFAWEG